MEIKQTFYDWCIENNMEKWLMSWDYEKNTKTPKETGFSLCKPFYFKCDCEKHKSFTRYIDSITKHKSEYYCVYCNSFQEWCVKNDKNEWLDNWDYEKNKISPLEVSYATPKKYYFKCPRNIHESQQYKISRIVEINQEFKCKDCNSIGQFMIDNLGEDAIEKYWSIKNEKSPFEIQKRSANHIWIKCTNTEYHEDSRVLSSNFVKGDRCSYCSTHSKKVDKKDSIGFLKPESIKLWSDKNKKTPFDFRPKANTKVWWKCGCGKHDDYSRTIQSQFLLNFTCPSCEKEKKCSSYQDKVNIYLSSLSFSHLKEYCCSILPTNPKTKMKLPFDNELKELKLIIEIHGEQHYKQLPKNNKWLNGKTPQEYLKYRRLLDRYKKFIAYVNGYEYLELPYWCFEDESYKELIDNKIKQIEERRQVNEVIGCVS